MNDRGQYGSRASAWRSHGQAVIGVTLFHGASDRDTAAAEIDAQLHAIAAAVITAAGGDPTVLPRSRSERADMLSVDWKNRVRRSRLMMERSPLLPLWDDLVSPVFTEWKEFYHERRNWYDLSTKWFTSWEDYVRWGNRINELRDQVEARGVQIQLAPMKQFHKSLQEEAEEAAGDIKEGLGDLFDILKYGLIGVLGIGAIVALSSVVSNVRRGKDPAEKYVGMIREGRRSRASSRALPQPRAQLALPPGSSAEDE